MDQSGDSFRNTQPLRSLNLAPGRITSQEGPFPLSLPDQGQFMTNEFGGFDVVVCYSGRAPEASGQILKIAGLARAVMQGFMDRPTSSTPLDVGRQLETFVWKKTHG